MTSQTYATSALLDAALDAVRSAARAANAVQQNLHQLQQFTKDDRSPVTVADFAVQAIVAMHLRRHLDHPLIVGEEHAGVLRQDDQAAVRAQVIEVVRTIEPDATADEVLDAIDACDHDATATSYWTLDPVDGTKGFLRGQQYTIALAWLERGQVQLGVMGCPNLPADHAAPLDHPAEVGVMYAAVLGEGAEEYQLEDSDTHATATPILVEPYDAARGLRVCESVEAAHSRQDDTARIIAHIGKAGPPARLDSQCKYAVVARGQADAYLRLPTRAGYREKIWDHAAGALIASEAGAVVSDITGKPLDFARGQTLEQNRGIICASPEVYQLLISAITALEIHPPD